MFWEEEMGYAFRRRQWLKTSTLAVAGLMASPRLVVSKRDLSFLLHISGEDKIIRLESNESPFGISDKAKAEIIRSIDLSNRYPHGHYNQLRELIAEREGIAPDHIILGAGSTEVMVTLIHLAKANGEIMVGDPTYFDFIYYANQAGCRLDKIRLNDNFEHDLDTMEKQVSARTSLIYICNPLNPTGSISSADDLKLFCERASEKAMVVVDEAYHEYVEDPSYSSMIDLVKEGKNIIVTRTFSKIFGLAGLRVGYGMADPEIIKHLKKISRNFAPVSWLSLKAAIATYNDQEFVRSVREKNSRMRRYLTKELDRIGLYSIPSQTNFVLFQIEQNAMELAKKLERFKILVRPFGFHDSQWIRVSCGTKEELRAFLSALASLI